MYKILVITLLLMPIILLAFLFVAQLNGSMQPNWPAAIISVVIMYAFIWAKMVISHYKEELKAGNIN